MNTFRFLQQQQAAQQRQQQMLASLLNPETPMQLIMDPRLPLSDQDRQNLWNQRAANQWSMQQQSMRQTPETSDPASALISKYTQMSGGLNPERNYSAVVGSPEWEQLDNKSRVGVIAKLFGNEKAAALQARVNEGEFNSKMQLRLAEDELQTRARMAGTEREMLSRNLISGDWMNTPEGLQQRNPAFNQAAAAVDPNLKQYMPATPDTQAIAFRNWNQVRPQSAMPLNAAQIAAMTFARDNPNATREQIALAGQSAVPNSTTPLGPNNQLTSSLTPSGVPQRSAYGMGQALRSPGVDNPLAPLRDFSGQMARAMVGMPAGVAAGLTNAASTVANRAFHPVAEFVAGAVGKPEAPYIPSPYFQPEEMQQKLYPQWLQNWMTYAQ